MLDFDLSPKFRVIGTSPSAPSVLGVIETFGGLDNKLVCLTLCETLTDHKRAERLAQVRADLNGRMINILGGGEKKLITEHFDIASADQFVCQVKHHEYAVQSMQLTLEESQAPIIHFACHTKSSFWNCLRAFGVDYNDMLSIAELQGFVDQEQEEAVSKPLGGAHRLCEKMQSDILKEKKKKSRGEDINPELIQKAQEQVVKVQQATKIRLPDYDPYDAFLNAWHTRDMIRLDVLKKLRQQIKNKNEKLSQSRGVRRIIGNISARMSSTGHSLKTVNAEIKSIRQEWKSRTGEVIEKITFPEYQEEMVTFDPVSPAKSKIIYKTRDGFHLMPSQYCLFEQDIGYVEDDREYLNYPPNPEKIGMQKHFLLAEDGDDHIHFSILFYDFEPGKGKTLGMAPFGFVASREEGRVKKLEVCPTDNPDVRYNTAESPFLIDQVEKLIGPVTQAISALSRFNDPDFKPQWKIPDKRLVKRFTGDQKMFRYLEVTDPLELIGARYQNLSEKGTGSHASPVLHWRRGHPRRQYDSRKNVIGVSIISPTIVGNAANGALKRGVDMNKARGLT